SHDRYFLDKTVDRLFVFEEGGKLRQYEGGYSDYLEKVQGNTPSVPPSGKASEAAGMKTEKVKTTKLKFTWQEQKEYETIEETIGEIEKKIASLEKQMELSATDFVRLGQLTREKEDAEALLEDKMERYLYLSDLADRIKKQ
ncbi:MAG TPA: ABC transporter ATP-binding protein, partial [Lachnospiraceae bacterium]|nr:ABC transporter ATP-binding protein [Lachnospiraceae bacterium]